MEEDLSWIVGCSIKVVLCTTDYTWISYWPKVYPKLLIVVIADLLIKYFADTIYSFWLQNCVYRGLVFRKVIPAKDCNSGGNEDTAVAITSYIQSIYTTVYVHLGCSIREALSKGGKNSGKMNNIVDFVVCYYFVVPSEVAHIQLLKSTWHRYFLIAYICCNDIILSYYITKCLDKWGSDLTFASSNKHSSFELFEKIWLVNQME